ncbi:MAG: DsrE family protein [Rhodospirillales bacterium]|jgi:sulfur relay (sulfurtransferase) complex TusBCD TusD component (DsrE family)|nr:DsrE family protein [Rhodospirillales bacterium]
MFHRLLVLLAIAGTLFALPAAADSRGSLFVNLTTDEGHRVDMALVFSKSVLERGHPVAIWLNDRGVHIAAKSKADDFASQQRMLSELMAKGAAVVVCPFCMKHYGVQDADLIDGAKVGNPELTGGYLFKDDTRTLTW